MSRKLHCSLSKPILFTFFLLVQATVQNVFASADSVEELVAAYQSKRPKLCINEGETLGVGITHFMKALFQHPSDEATPELTGKLERLMAEGTPLVFVLPGFPFKSNNASKVITSGHIDLAEVLALETLDHLALEIARVYKPGASITIVPDAIRITEFLGNQVARDRYLETLGQLNPSPRITIKQLHEFEGSPTYGQPLEAIAAHLACIDAGDVQPNIYLPFVTRELGGAFYHQAILPEDCALINAQEAVQFSTYLKDLFDGYENCVRLSVNRHTDDPTKFFAPLIFGSKATAWHGSIFITKTRLIKLGNASEKGTIVSAAYRGVDIKWIQK